MLIGLGGDAGLRNTACIGLSEADVRAVSGTTYGNWTQTIGTSTTPKGHTVWWGACDNGDMGNDNFYITLNGVRTLMRRGLVLANSSSKEKKATTIGLWLADKLLFGE